MVLTALSPQWGWAAQASFSPRPLPEEGLPCKWGSLQGLPSPSLGPGAAAQLTPQTEGHGGGLSPWGPWEEAPAETTQRL